MTKRFLATAAFVLLSSTASVYATDIGATVETAWPLRRLRGSYLAVLSR